MSLSVGDLIEYDEQMWRLVSFDPPIALLREADSPATAASTAVDLKTLMSVARRHEPDTAGDQVWPLFDPNQAGGFDASATLARLPQDYRAEIEAFAADIAELETGYRPDAEVDDAGVRVARDGFDPDVTSKSARIDLMIQRKADAVEEFPSKASLYRSMARYRKHGVAGLIDQRKYRPRFPLVHLDPRLVQVIFDVHEAEVNGTTGTRRRFIRRVKAEVGRRYPDVAERPVVPPESTMYRQLETLLAGKRTFEDATSRRNNHPATGPTLFPRTPFRPGELVQADSTTFDVMVTDEARQRTFRPHLSTVVDVATRTLLSWDFKGPGPDGGQIGVTSNDIALLISDACFPLPLRPSINADITKALALAPLADVVSRADLVDAVREFPIIYPEAINVDNGSNFVSARSHRHLEELKIDIIRSRKARPTDKPNVERLYQSLHTMFAESLPGYVGYNSQRRGGNIRRQPNEEFLTLNELRAVFTVFVLTVYQRRPHSELTILGHAANTPLSPNMAFATFAKWSGSIYAPNNTDAAIELLPKTFVDVGMRGVRVQGSTFDDPVLAPYRGKPGPHGGKYAISYDPRRADFAYFKDPGSGHIHALRNAKQASSTAPMFGELTTELLEGADSVGPTHTAMLNALDPATNNSHAADLESWRTIAHPDYTPPAKPEPEQQPARQHLEDGPDPHLNPETVHHDDPFEIEPEQLTIPDLETRS